MKETATKFKTVEEYFANYPPKTRSILKEVRKIIKETAPQAEELISYNMPAFKLNGPLVYYAAYAKHIGFYPTPSAIEAFKKQLSKYVMAKGSVQFPIEEPMPLSLIKQMVEYKVKENLSAAKKK